MVLRRFYSTSSAKEAAARIAAISTAPAAEPSRPRPAPLTQGRLKPCGPYSMSERLLAARLSRLETTLFGPGAKASYITGPTGTRGRRRRFSIAQMGWRRGADEAETDRPQGLFVRVQRDRLDSRGQLLPPRVESAFSTMFAEANAARVQSVEPYQHESTPSVLGEEFSLHTAFAQLGIAHHLGPYDPPQPSEPEVARDPHWDVPFEDAARRQNAPVDPTLMWWAPAPSGDATQLAQHEAQLQKACDTLEALVDSLQKERKVQAEAQLEMMQWAAQEAEAAWVYMDSVQRKRRKMIKKMKWKKRRKAQRAVRKKLGK